MLGRIKKGINEGKIMLGRIKKGITEIVYAVFRCLPVENKVVATTFRGRKYGDNAAYIVEKIHEMDPSVKIVWLKNSKYDYEVPEYITVDLYDNELRRLFQLATSKVWINTHRIESITKKRKNQIFIETWHGGILPKKVELWIPRVASTKWETDEIKTTCALADVFISNSKQCTDVPYRQEFGYKGRVWEIGYPRTDYLLNNDSADAKYRIQKFYNLNPDSKLLVYAPTFRDGAESSGVLDMSVYEIDYDRLRSQLNKRWGGEWYILLRLHPVLTNYSRHSSNDEHLIDVTKYPNMQELALCCDAFISDYSSAIFDAAIIRKPCFIYAKDYEEYKATRGFAIDVKSLPFQFANNESELLNNIATYDDETSNRSWSEFSMKIGICETGHASKDVAKFVLDYLAGKSVFENTEFV